MSSHPYFTIITPVYNRENIVSKTIESVLNQDFIDFEYLLIDDCSTDNSFDVLSQFEKSDSRLKAIHLEQNEGRCSARNKGLELANGKWICYLDSDDIYFTNHLSLFKQLIESHSDFNVFALGKQINGNPERLPRKLNNLENVKLSFDDFIEGNPLISNQICHVNNKNISWSKERLPISEDWLFMRNLVLTHSILFRKVVSSNLIEHDERSMNTASADFYVQNNLRGADLFIQNNSLSNSINNRIKVHTLLLCANVHLSNCQKKEGFILLKKCLKYPRTYISRLFYKGLIKFCIN